MRSIGQTVQKLSSGNKDRYADTQTHRQTCVKPLLTYCSLTKQTTIMYRQNKLLCGLSIFQIMSTFLPLIK